MKTLQMTEATAQKAATILLVLPGIICEVRENQWWLWNIHCGWEKSTVRRLWVMGPCEALWALTFLCQSTLLFHLIELLNPQYLQLNYSRHFSKLRAADMTPIIGWFTPLYQISQLSAKSQLMPANHIVVAHTLAHSPFYNRWRLGEVSSKHLLIFVVLVEFAVGQRITLGKVVSYGQVGETQDVRQDFVLYVFFRGMCVKVMILRTLSHSGCAFVTSSFRAPFLNLQIQYSSSCSGSQLSLYCSSYFNLVIVCPDLISIYLSCEFWGDRVETFVEEKERNIVLEQRQTSKEGTKMSVLKVSEN